MEWINLHTSTLESQAYLMADDRARSVWLSLLRYCAVQENGGRIPGAQIWPDKTWRTLCRVDLKSVQRQCDLWRWEGQDLLVEFYPTKQQTAIQKSRVTGLQGAHKRWHGSGLNGDAIPMANPLAYDSTTPIGGLLGSPMEGPMRKGREGKGREGKGTPAPEDSLSELGSEDPHIPSLEECLLWAGMAGVDPDWTTRKFTHTSETHAWVRNGRLIGWKRLWKQWFDDDRTEGRWPRPGTAAAKNAAGPAPRELWQIEQDLKTVQGLISEHPCARAAIGQEFTAEQRAEYQGLKNKSAALKAQRSAMLTSDCQPA